MSADYASTSPAWLMHLGDIRWVRGHISAFFIGAVLLVCAELLFGGGEHWSFTAIGIWIMLLLVHIVVVLISRLSLVLAADDDDEVVLLPVMDALIVEPKVDPAATWSEPPAGAPTEQTTADEAVSWSVATDMAQAKRNPNKDTAK